jgi:hypothetical protein
MRTTLELTPDAYHLAKSVARERKKSMGAVVSEFIVRPVTEERTGEIIYGVSSAGFPTFRVVGAKPITTEEVKAMIDEMQDEEDARNC